MIFEIKSSYNRNAEFLSKFRFNTFEFEKNIITFRKYYNIQDDFLYQCILYNDDIIAHQNNPKEFQRLWKLLLRNKVDADLFMCLSTELHTHLSELVGDNKFSFCLSESFDGISEKQITISEFKNPNFFFDCNIRYSIVR